tara:strand:+ start:165 stop:482 length:318 start_codon:yes stop_codon:yes gene_type:complete
MTDEKEGIWNGGNTYTRRELEILRKQEDYYDATDSERETREELVKREKMMKEESNYQEIQSNHKVSRKPMHELYKGINKQINNFEKWKDERTPWSRMAGPDRSKK